MQALSILSVYSLTFLTMSVYILSTQVPCPWTFAMSNKAHNLRIVNLTDSSLIQMRSAFAKESFLSKLPLLLILLLSAAQVCGGGIID